MENFSLSKLKNIYTIFLSFRAEKLKKIIKKALNGNFGSLIKNFLEDFSEVLKCFQQHFSFFLLIFGWPSQQILYRPQADLQAWPMRILEPFSGLNDSIEKSRQIWMQICFERMKSFSGTYNFRRKLATLNIDYQSRMQMQISIRKENVSIIWLLNFNVRFFSLFPSQIWNSIRFCLCRLQANFNFRTLNVDSILSIIDDRIENRKKIKFSRCFIDFHASWLLVLAPTFITRIYSSIEKQTVMDNRFYFCPFSHHVCNDHNSSSDKKFTTFHYLLTIFMPQWKRKQLLGLVLFIFLNVVVVVIFTSLFSLKYCYVLTFMLLSRFYSFVKNNLRIVRENRKILLLFCLFVETFEDEIMKFCDAVWLVTLWRDWTVGNKHECDCANWIKFGEKLFSFNESFWFPLQFSIHFLFIWKG